MDNSITSIRKVVVSNQSKEITTIYLWPTSKLPHVNLLTHFSPLIDIHALAFINDYQ